MSSRAAVQRAHRRLDTAGGAAGSADRRWYRSDRRRLAEVRALIEEFWEDRLDALAAAAEAEARSRG